MRKLKWLVGLFAAGLFAVGLLAGSALGQGVRFDSNITTAAKNVAPGTQAPIYSMPGALITVCAYPAEPSGAVCTNTVAVYSDKALTQPLTQPISADSAGAFGFWVAPGTYAYSVQNALGAYLGTYSLSVAVGAERAVQSSPAASQTVTQPAGTALTINGDFRAGTVTSGVVNSAPNSAVRAIIYDDDCANDWDCLFTMADLQYWVNTQNVSVAAVVANSSNPSAAPMIHLLNAYYGHGGIPVGAWQGSNPATGSDSTWVASTVANFCPSSGLCPSGDTRANYSGCVSTLRTALAAAANNSISYVETGFMTCLAALMQSPADSISALTGAQLLQAKVSQLDVMGGQYPNSSASASNECIPAGGAEFNFACDAADAAYVMSNWTSQNGYPPMYLNGYSIGATVNSGVPYWFPSSDPVVYGSGVAGTNSRPSWDALSLCHAVLGNAGCGMTLSASGTNTVNASTGANTWASTTASGQYYVTKSQPDTFYQAILDGINYNGANRAYPAMAGSINGYLGLQSNSVFPGYIPRLVVGVAGNSSNVPFTAIGGKVASFSSDSNYGQIQIANPAMAAEGIGFLDCMTAPANLGDAPGTGTCGTNWALGTSAFGASGFALGNARLGSWEMNLDDHGDMTLRGDGGGTNFGTNLKLDSTMMTGGHLWTMASGGSSDFAGAGSLSLTDNTAGILRWWIDGGGSSYQQAAIPAANSSWLSTIKNTQAPAAGDYLKGQAQFCPNLVAGAYCFTALGQGAAANNAFSLIFGYAGSGSPNNSLTVGSYQGPPIASFYADGSFALASTAGISCSSARAGVLNYIAGAAGVKDTVQVCAKDASNAWAWRTIY